MHIHVYIVSTALQILMHIAVYNGSKKWASPKSFEAGPNGCHLADIISNSFHEYNFLHFD